MSSVTKNTNKFNIYPFLQNCLSYIQKIFIKKTKYPIISIILFIIVIVLNSIQYSKNDKRYLQNKVIKTSKSHEVYLSNALLYIYDIIGINGFITNTPAFILYFILTYLCLALIEMNIGYIVLLFLLLICIMFNNSISGFQSAVCLNYINEPNQISRAPYCCGSFILYMSIGFVLYIIFKNMNTSLKKGGILFLILCIWIACFLVDKYINFANSTKDTSITTCEGFLWHALNFLLGVFSGLVLAN